MYIRHEVNDMGRKMCRLENMSSATGSDQQNAVNRVASSLPLIANNTENAINFLNNHQNTLWLPMYRSYVDNLYREADHVVKTTHGTRNGALESSARLRPSS
jgi:hypothetical protein